MVKRIALTMVGVLALSAAAFADRQSDSMLLASPFDDEPVVIEQSANPSRVKQANWRCYWCDSKAQTTPTSPHASTPRANPPNPLYGGECKSKAANKPQGNRHYWVWVGGISPAHSSHSCFVCDKCGKFISIINPGRDSAVPPQESCSKGGNHKWDMTHIVME